MLRTALMVLLVLPAVVPAPLHAAPRGGRYALLVGVRQYDRAELTPLEFPENDVTVLADVLRRAGYRRVVLMTQTRGAFEARYLPTAGNIRRELKGLLEDRTEHDSILIAFCGHGVQFAGSDEPYFCPMDAALRDRKTLLSLSETYAQLNTCKARFKLLLSDACRNDPLPRNRRTALGSEVFSPSKARERPRPPENVVALFSCSAGEFAYESEKVKHGVFFHFLIEGLRGKARLGKNPEVTLGALVDYVQREVRDFVKEEVGASVRQRPELVGRYSGTLAVVELTRNLQRDDPRHLADKRQALDHLTRGNYRQALSILDRVLKVNTDDPWALAMRACAHDHLGDRKRALADASQAIRIDPNVAPAYNTRGNVFLHEKKLSRAIDEYTQAIRKFRGGHPTAYYNRGRAHAQNGNWKQALADYDEQLRINPKHAGALHARGILHAQRKNLDLALRDFSLAIQCDRQFAAAYTDRGLVHALRGDDTTARKDYDEAIRLDDRSALPFYLRGNLHLRAKQYRQAIDDYTEAIRRRTNYVAARYNRGRAFYYLDEHGAAIKDFTEVIRIDPRHAIAFHARGICHAAQGRLTDAISDYSRAIQLDATDPAFFANRGRAYSKLGQKSKSAEDLAMAKKLEALRNRKGAS